ncbi:MAG: HAMP domain-containing sensor histidine kinase [Variovorax sp.]
MDQLLRLSRHEAAAATELPTQVDVAPWQGSVGGIIALADQRGIDLGVEDVNPAEAYLDCPPGDLRSVIDNLVEALRYRRAAWSCAPCRSGWCAGVAIEVVDTGPGIPEDMLPRVFDRFFRVPGTEVRGNGLGLAITGGGGTAARVVLANKTDRSGLVARVEQLTPAFSARCASCISTPLPGAAELVRRSRPAAHWFAPLLRSALFERGMRGAKSDGEQVEVLPRSGKSLLLILT